MASQDNRLRLILEAQTGGLKTGLTTARTEIKKTSDALKLFVHDTEAASKASTQQTFKVPSNSPGTVSLQPTKSTFGAPDPESISAWDKFNAKVTQAKETFDDWAPKIKSAAQDYIRAASELRGYETKLKAFTGSASEAKKEFEQLQAVARKTGFPIADIVDAAVVFKELRVSVSDLLPVAQTLVKVAGGSIVNASKSLALAVDGNVGALNRLQRSFGVTKDELIRYGAATDAFGEIAVDTIDRQNQLVKAFQNLTKIKFPNVLEDAGAKLSATINRYEEAVTELKASLGEALIPIKKFVYEGLLLIVDTLNKIPQPIKEVVGGFAAFAAGAVAIVAIVTPILTVIETLGAAAVAATGVSAALGAATAASGAFSVAALGAAGPVGLLVGGITLGIVALTTWYNESRQATLDQEKLNAACKKTNETLKKTAPLFNKSAEELRALGASARDLIPGLEAAYEALDEIHAKQAKAEADRKYRIAHGAYEEDFTEAEKAAKKKMDLEEEQARKEVALRQKTKAALAALTGPQTVDPAVKAAQDATNADLRYNEEKRKHTYQTKTEELAALNQVRAAQDKAIDELKKKLALKDSSNMAPEMVEAYTKRLEEVQKAQKENSIQLVEIHNEQRQEDLTRDKEAMQQKIALGQMGLNEEAAQLKELAKKYSDQRLDSAALDREAAVKSMEYIRQVHELKLATLDSEKSAIDVKLQLVEKQIAADKNLAKNEKEKLALIKEQFKNEAELLRAHANQQEEKLQGAGNKNLRLEIEKKLQIDLSALRSREKLAETTAQDEYRARMAEKLRLNQELIQSNSAVIDAELGDLKRRQDRSNEDVTKPIKAKTKALQKAALEEIEINRQIALKAKDLNPQMVANINKKFDNEVTKKKIENREQIEDLDKGNLERNTKRTQDQAELDKRIVDEKKAAFDDAIAQGKAFGNLAIQEKELAEQKLIATIKEIQARAAAEKASDPAKSAIIQRDAQLQIQAALRETRKELKGINDQYKTGNTELDKEIKKLEKIKGVLDKLKGEQEQADEAKEDEDNGGMQSGADMEAERKRKDKMEREEIKRRRSQDTVDELTKKEKMRQNAEAERRGTDAVNKAGAGGDNNPDAREKRRKYLEAQGGRTKEELDTILDREFGKGAGKANSPITTPGSTSNTPGSSPAAPGSIPSGGMESILGSILTVCQGLLQYATGKSSGSPSISTSQSKSSFSPTPLTPGDQANLQTWGFRGKQ